MRNLLKAFILAVFLPTALYAQSIGTYTEDNGAVRNNIGVGGGVATGEPVSGNPIVVGGVYSSSPTAVQNGDVARIWTNLQGAQMIAGINIVSSVDAASNGIVGMGMSDATSGGALLTATRYFNGSTWDRMRGDTNGLVVQPALSSTFWNYAAAASGIVNTTTAVTIKTAAGASVRNYVCSLTLSNDTLGAATEFAIRDGAAGTVMWRGRLQTTAKTDTLLTFSPCLKGTANTLTEVVTLTAVTGGVYVNAQGHTGS